MQKKHGTPHSLEKLRFRWDVLGAVVQNGPKSQGRAVETPKDFWICIRINLYINPYINPCINPYINPYEEQLAEWCQRQSPPNPAEETFGSGEVTSATALRPAKPT